MPRDQAGGGKGHPPPRRGSLPPPITQLETNAPVLPELEDEGGRGQGSGSAKGTRQLGGKDGASVKPGRGRRSLLGLGLLRRRRRGQAAEHYGFAPPGMMPSPDKLRGLPTTYRRTPVSGNLHANREYLQQAFGESWDIVYRDLRIGLTNHQAMLVFVDGLVDKEAIQRFAILALTLDARAAGIDEFLAKGAAMDEIQHRIVGFGEVRVSADLAEIVDRLVGGETALFVGGERSAILMDTRGWRDRGVQEPVTEVSVRGPRDGFNETLKTSTSLLRRRLRTPLLRLERMSIGDYTRTDVVVAYIEGVANEEVLREVRRRLNRIVLDSVLESQYIEELVQDDPATFFPLVRATEYPDRIAAGLLEGRVAIMTDTTPFALMVPATLTSLMQSAEDHYERPAVTSAVRVMRVFALLLAVFGSAVYVAAVNFQPEIIPAALLERLVQAKRGVPFGTAVEILILESAFEILREAGIRLPRAIGQAVSIVGALVLGEAAVAAGLVSSAVVIVVALSAIASLSLPSYFLTLGMRLLRFPLIVLAATLGAYGLALGTTILLAHMASLTSFGVPYLAPVAPFSLSAWRRDVLVRVPRWAMDTRPAFLGSARARRAGPNLKPGPTQPNPQPNEPGQPGDRGRGGLA
jgi:spore germination protein KA